ncbi:MAG: NAD(P)H-quinone oxidoreductase [Pseudomonadales bacterium]|nr:NAD(P)H-quinone oxidoreductase [Pseudomonadales bacterium]
MKAININENGELRWEETETPMPRNKEILIKIAATAINRADLMQRAGFYPPPLGASSIMGLECAGEIVALGDGVSHLQLGDKVCALLAGGGYAEFVAVDEGSAIKIPEGLSLVEAASLPEVFATAWLNLYMEAKLIPGESVILHAGASGVGTAGIQLCRTFGNTSFVTVGSEDKLKACLDLGASAGSNRHEGSFLEPAQNFAGENGVDVILDPVGASYLSDNLNLLGLNGRLVLIGLMGGASTEINLANLLMKRIRVIGSTLRARPLPEKAEVMKQLLNKVWPKIAAKEIKPVIDSVFSINDIEKAHGLVASDNTIGKVVLTVS